MCELKNYALCVMRYELCVMRRKNDAKFETELTCHLKIDMRNFNGLILIKAEATN